MTRKDIEEIVKEFLIEDLEIDEENIRPEAHLKEEVGIDSLDFVDIVVIVEKKFGFKIKPEEMAGVTTLSQFCDYIESKVGDTASLTSRAMSSEWYILLLPLASAVKYRLVSVRHNAAGSNRCLSQNVSII